MRKLDWFLAGVIGLFLAAALAAEAGGFVGGVALGLPGTARGMALNVATDIVRLPASWTAECPTVLPRR
jgi:hypothetical protein